MTSKLDTRRPTGPLQYNRLAPDEPDMTLAIRINYLPNEVNRETLCGKLTLFGKMTNIRFNVCPMERYGTSVVAHYQTRKDAVAAQMILNHETHEGCDLNVTLLVPEEERDLENNGRRNLSTSEYTSNRGNESMVDRTSNMGGRRSVRQYPPSSRNTSFDHHYKLNGTVEDIKDSDRQISRGLQFRNSSICGRPILRQGDHWQPQPQYRMKQELGMWLPPFYRPIYEKGKHCWQVHVENLALETSGQDLANIFRQYGEIVEVLINEPGSRDTRPFKSSDIYFKTREEAIEASKIMNDFNWNSRILRVGVIIPTKNLSNKTKENQVKLGKAIDMSLQKENCEVPKEEKTKNGVIDNEDFLYDLDNPDNEWRVQVTNLVYETSETDIKQLFQRFGEITKIEITKISNRFQAKSVIADICYKTREQAKCAQYMNKVVVNCRLLSVVVFEPVVRICNWPEEVPLLNVEGLFSIVGQVLQVLPERFLDGRFYVFVTYDSCAAATRADKRFHECLYFGRELRVHQLLDVE